MGLAIPLAWLWTVVTPSEEAVKIRNALILEMGKPADFAWTPEARPADFLADRGAAPVSFTEPAKVAGLPQRISTEGEFATALALSRTLMGTEPRIEGPIQADNATTLHEMIVAHRGYCADFTQVFMAAANTIGMPVREWSIAFSAFGAGHAFTEVYDRHRAKWILVDSFHSLYFTDPANAEPLSVLQVHDRLLGIGANAGIGIVRIVPERFPFRSDAVALDYYRRGMPQLAMTWGTNVFDYERSKLVRAAGKLSRSLEQIVAITLGEFPKSRVYPVGVSDRDFREVMRKRNQFLAAAFAAGFAFLVFGAQALRLAARRHD